MILARRTLIQGASPSLLQIAVHGCIMTDLLYVSLSLPLFLCSSHTVSFHNTHYFFKIRKLEVKTFQFGPSLTSTSFSVPLNLKNWFSFDPCVTFPCLRWVFVRLNSRCNLSMLSSSFMSFPHSGASVIWTCSLLFADYNIQYVSIVLQMTISQLKAELEKGPQEAAVYTQQIHQLQSNLNNLQQQSQVPHKQTIIMPLRL